MVDQIKYWLLHSKQLIKTNTTKNFSIYPFFSGSLFSLVRWLVVNIEIKSTLIGKRSIEKINIWLITIPVWTAYNCFPNKIIYWKVQFCDGDINQQLFGSIIFMPTCTINIDISSKSGWITMLSCYIPGYNHGWCHGYVMCRRCCVWNCYLPKILVFSMLYL